MQMTSSLTPQQCDTMREFFALLLKIKQLDVRNKGISVGVALDVWNYEQFGYDKKGITYRRKAGRLMN